MDDRGRSGKKLERDADTVRRVRIPSGFALIGLIAAVVLSLWPIAASASADTESGAAPPDDAVVALPSQEGVPTGEAPAGDGASPGVGSAAGPTVPPDPLVPSELPVGDDAAATDTPVPPAAETDELEGAQAPDQPNADAAGPTRDTDAPREQAAAVSAPAVTVASMLSPTAPDGALIVPALAAHRPPPKRSPWRLRAVAPPWERPGSLVPALVIAAWHAPARHVPSSHVPLTPDRHGVSSPRRAHDKSVTPASPESPPPAPRAPGSSTCAGSSTCGAGFLAMLPPLAALGCLCALLFELLREAMSLWRPERFLSLRERPG